METSDAMTTGATGGLAEELAAAAPRRWWNRGTLLLGLACLLAAAFIAGLQVQQRWGEPATAGGGPSRPGGFAADAPPGGFGARGGGQPSVTASADPETSGGDDELAGTTTGTVRLIDGTTVYVETPDGVVVTVRTGDSTEVLRSAPSALTELAAGDEVTVIGESAAPDTLTATRITTQN